MRFSSLHSKSREQSKVIKLNIGDNKPCLWVNGVQFLIIIAWSHATIKSLANPPFSGNGINFGKLLNGYNVTACGKKLTLLEINSNLLYVFHGSLHLLQKVDDTSSFNGKIVGAIREK